MLAERIACTQPLQDTKGAGITEMLCAFQLPHTSADLGHCTHLIANNSVLN